MIKRIGGHTLEERGRPSFVLQRRLALTDQRHFETSVGENRPKHVSNINCPSKHALVIWRQVSWSPRSSLLRRTSPGLKSDADRDLLEAVKSVVEQRHFLTDRANSVRPQRVLRCTHLVSRHEKKDARSTHQPRRRDYEAARRWYDQQRGGRTTRDQRQNGRSHRINIGRKLGFNSVADLVPICHSARPRRNEVHDLRAVTHPRSSTTVILINESYIDQADASVHAEKSKRD
jgi:hypothetical protein